MFPYAHTKSISDVSIKLSAQSLHTSYLEIVNPPYDKLIEFHNLIAVTNSPTPACEFSHFLFELHY